MKFRFVQEKIDAEHKLFIRFGNGEQRLANDVELQLFYLLDKIKYNILRSYKEDVDVPLEEIGVGL